MQSIEAANENALQNQIKNAHFICCTAEEQITSHGSKDTTVVLDPPRSGCDIKVLEALVGLDFQKIIYISCEPSTLARDLKYFVSNNYRCSAIQPLDMFPQTIHVETVVLMSRVKE